VTRKNFLIPNIIFDLGQCPIFDHVSNGVVITDQNSTILYTNPAFTRITGYSKQEAKGNNPGLLHSGKHDKKFYQDMWGQITKKGYWEGEIWNRRKSGEIYPEFLTISTVPQEKKKFYYVAIFSDISFLKEDSKKKLHLAFYDPLTKLPNRTLYLDRIKNIIEESKNNKKNKIAIFYMDLDKFKSVNDTYGHYVGDLLLHNIGKRLMSLVRAGDTIARIGGDEFTAILKIEDDTFSASDLAYRILENIEKPFIIEKHKIGISISIGYCFFPKDAKTIEELIKKADKAMYTAKKTGKKVVSYSSIK
jgi:diguanylate cyclase (GGDEF)-like protein/PAS domain S-box-containing protein